MKKFCAILILATIFASCNNNVDNDYFNGKIKTVKVNNTIKKEVTSQAIALDGAFSGIIAVSDSLLICWTPYLADAHYSVFNVDTGKNLGSFCGKGHGSNESVSLGCIFQLYKANDDLMALLHAANEDKLFVWNITKSVCSGKTIYDKVLECKNNRVFSLFRLSEDMMLLCKPSDDISRNKITTPYCQMRTISQNKLVKDYPIYINDEMEYTGETPDPFYSWNAIHPDGSKIVSVMKYLPQINILDTKRGDITGYRLDASYDFSYLLTSTKLSKVFYNHVHADSDFIYATYWGKEQWNDSYGSKMPNFNKIHIYDWDGNLRYELTTDKSYLRIWSDSTRKRLYTV
ncbi:MAG: hypothetical protein R3Y26_08765 [Rikenellaceae bacterium]